MYIKKIFIFYIILILIFPSFCFADDILEDYELDFVLEVSNDSKNPAKEPVTNSKHIIAIDRKSLTVLYEKDAYLEVPMASTTNLIATR